MENSKNKDKNSNQGPESADREITAQRRCSEDELELYKVRYPAS